MTIQNNHQKIVDQNRCNSDFLTICFANEKKRMYLYCHQLEVNELTEKFPLKKIYDKFKELC